MELDAVYRVQSVALNLEKRKIDTDDYSHSDLKLKRRMR